MYKIRGADQKEYGPVTADQVRHWIAEGRANAGTQVQAAGGTEWQELGNIPEFADQLRPASPPFPGAAPATGAAPAGSAKTSTLAVISLILGIMGFLTCGLTAIPGIITGLLGMNRVKKSNGTLTGFGAALAGTIVSVVSLLFLPIMAALLLPALAKAKDRAETINCVNNLKQLALAVRIYSAENTNHFPSAATWCDALKTQVHSEKVFQCPHGDVNQSCHYAFNAKLDGMEDGKIDPETVVLFEIESGWNKSGGPELMLRAPRHRQVFAVAFADGSVRQISAAEAARLRWDP